MRPSKLGWMQWASSLRFGRMQSVQLDHGEGRNPLPIGLFSIYLDGSRARRFTMHHDALGNALGMHDERTMWQAILDLVVSRCKRGALSIRCRS